MKQEDADKKENEIDFIFEKVLEAVPKDVYMENIIIALSRLAGAFAWELSENDDEEDDDSYGTLPGTSFSKS